MTKRDNSTAICPAVSFETVPDAEAEQIDDIAALTVQFQDVRAKNDPNQDGCPLRGVHPKSHGCVKATFTVNGNIAEKHRIGLFAEPGKTYQAWIRFSNAAVLREDDLKANRDGERQNGSRGMAIKVMDVDGEMLSLDNERSNQDFLMINTPEFAFANVRDYLRLDRILALDQQKAADPSAYFIPAILAQLGEPKPGEPTEVTIKRQNLQAVVANLPFLQNLTLEDLKGTIASAKIAKKIAQQTVRNPMQVQYFGAAPFLFGPNQAMKFSSTPAEPIHQAPFDEITKDSPSENYLREALDLTMAGSDDICFDFMIQTRTADTQDLNIEDATTTWVGEQDGYESVAKIIIKAPQNPSRDAEEAQCEQLAFSPWHALAAHQPIGGINRLRRKVYADSAKHRGASNY